MSGMNDATAADTSATQTNVTVPGPPARRFREIGRSLAHRNFRLFFAGQSVSLLGTWMQQTAMTWLVYRLTKEHGQDSAFLLGVTGFAGQIPVLLLGPFAGVYSDRWHRHRIIIATQTLSMLQAFLLWILTLAGVITVWQLIELSLFLGCVNAFDMPTRQAFMTEMLDTREDLANAIALNSSTVNGARLIGPSIAGFVISLVGEATCFLLNGISFLGVIVALLAMKIPRKSREGSPSSVLCGLQEGFRYAFGFPPVRALLLLVALIGLVGMPYVVLMPIFAGEILHGGARTLGVLIGSSGVGALIGSLYLASRSTVVGLGRWIAAMTAVFGIGLIAFSFSRSIWLSMAFLAVMGFAVIVQLASCNTILQTIVDEQQRGRVMSLYTTAFLGMSPLGSLVAGGLASAIGAPNTLRLGGACCILGAIGFASQLPKIRRHVRPIYTRMGILPAVAAGLQQATEQTVPHED
jgi:MFS family permease